MQKSCYFTGGGDNFNAGFCYAQLNKLDLYQSLLVANAVSGYYVKTGISLNAEQLKDFLLVLGLVWFLSCF